MQILWCNVVSDSYIYPKYSFKYNMPWGYNIYHDLLNWAEISTDYKKLKYWKLRFFFPENYHAHKF